MKKIALLALMCVAFLAPNVVSAQEVTYVEDPSQGYLFNRMRDNWFIDAEGGIGIFMSPYDANAPFGKRIGFFKVGKSYLLEHASIHFLHQFSQILIGIYF